VSEPLETEYQDVNDIAEVYDLHKFDVLMRHYMMRSLRPHLVPGRALELGCFMGEFTELLAKEFDDLTVVDAAQRFIEHTRRRVGDRVHFINGLFETFPAEGTFDSIFLMHVIEHLQDPVVVLDRARKLLSDSGRIFMVVPNGTAASRQIAVKMGIIPHLTALTEADTRHGHRRVYCFDTLERDARAAGLTIRHRSGVFFKALANVQFEKLIGGDVISDDYLEACYELGMEYPQLCASIFLVCEK